MTPFIIGFSIIALTAFGCRYGRKKERNTKIFIAVSFLVLFVLLGFKAPHLGTDSNSYNNIFMRIGQQNSLGNAFAASGISAPGYVVFCRVIYRLFPYTQARIIGTALVILIGVYRYIRKTSNNVYLSVLLFISLTFYVQSFNISRQYMAMAILLNAFAEWYSNKKSVLGWVLFILAMTFHTTAIVGLAVWFIIGNRVDYSNNKQLRRLIAKALLLGTAAILTQTRLIDTFLRLFPIYRNYFGNRALNQFSDQGQGRAVVIVFGYLAVLLYCLFILRKSRKDHEERILAAEQLPVMLFSIIIGIVGATSPVIIRMNSFFTITAITFIPNVFYIDKPSNRRILTGITLLLTFAFLMIYMIEDKSDVIPYTFFWS